MPALWGPLSLSKLNDDQKTRLDFSYGEMTDGETISIMDVLRARQATAPQNPSDDAGINHDEQWNQ